MEKSIYSAEYRELCRILRELRREAGLTQVQVAERLGVPQSFVSKYETGERRLDVIELKHIASAIETDIHQVLAILRAE
ncbi:helix-turn-helix domain-containing protein [Amycolatopsis thermoflava]|uniref:helix-turn-helix domain-containing protein n=1 Tax=Amycolatopsis thermoflava TaxID=84480 RepID=UPI00382C07DE